MKYDFSGWATKNNVRCSDGRTIMKDAFAECDGMTVPLVYAHDHTSISNVLGHALLENRDEGVYLYGTFNNSKEGNAAKERVRNGDIRAVSIYANHLKEKGSNVVHGMIREVSLVLAGANPGALIDSVLVHGEEINEATIYTGEELELYHAETEANSDQTGKGDDSSNEGETVAEILDTLTEKQKKAVYAVVAEAAGEGEEDDDDDDDDEGGDETMKHNVFDAETGHDGTVLCHADQEEILKLAKSGNVGTFQNALKVYAEENNLKHDALSSGFAQTGDGNVSWLFPEYKDVRPGAPELITNDQGWITTVLNKVHKSPISRIRTRQVDIRNVEGSMDTLRARGYIKGKQKKLAGNITLARRTTDPQTVYVKSALNRDDIVDITDFDYVQYLYNIDRMQLNEELATAIMIGDGRDISDEGKIDPNHIRPIWLDDDLYTLHVDLDLETARQELQGSGTGVSFGDNFVTAEAMITTVLYAREKFKGSGTPDLFITPHMVNVMMLARDMNGRRIYSSVSELASALNVGAIHTAEQFEGKTRKATINGAEKTKKLVCILANLADYSLGATKGGQIAHFTQFDLNFNQQMSLLETRCSGALTRVYSAIAIEEDVTDSAA